MAWAKGEVQHREKRSEGGRQRGGQGVTRAKRRGDGRGRRLQLKAVAVVVMELVVVGMMTVDITRKRGVRATGYMVVGPA